MNHQCVVARIVGIRIGIVAVTGRITLTKLTIHSSVGTLITRITKLSGWVNWCDSINAVAIYWVRTLPLCTILTGVVNRAYTVRLLLCITALRFSTIVALGKVIIVMSVQVRERTEDMSGLLVSMNSMNACKWWGWNNIAHLHQIYQCNCNNHAVHHT